MSDLRRRLLVLLRRGRWDRDLAEEMRNHLDLQAEENQGSGMDARRARDAARRQFGNAALVQEDSAEVWGWGPVERVAQDLRYAARQLRHNRGFAMVAALSLALGIGATAAIFTVCNAALLRALPVRNPGELFIAQSTADGPLKGLWKKNSNDRIDPATGRRIYTTFPLAVLREFRSKAGTAADMFAFFSPGRITVSGESGSRPARITLVSGSFFDGLGVSLFLGRGLGEDDDRSGTSAIVITHSFWERELNRDASILGKTLRINGIPMAVAGVTAPGFHGVAAAGFDGPTDVFGPLSALDAIAPDEFRASGRPKTAPDYWWVQIMGRRRPGVSLRAAAERLTPIFRGVLADSGAPGLVEAKNPRILTAPGDKGLDTLREKIERPLVILLAAAGVVLLLACINIASLQLARAAARRREIAVRLSLGAGRGRILRQLLIESLLLAAIGSAAGLAIAVAGAPVIAGLLTIGPTVQSVWLDLSPDLRVLAFTAVAASLAGVMCGLTPAFQAARVDIALNLKPPTQRASRRSAFARGNALIAAQAALSLLLLAGAGLLLRTLGNLHGVDAGFARDHLLLFRLDLKPVAPQPGQAGPIYDAILQSIAATPGVRSAAAMSHLLIGGWRNSTALSSRETEWQPVETLMNTVSPGFFDTVGMPLVAGRVFSPRDRPDAVILNQTAARRFCGTQAAVGQTLRRHTGSGMASVEVIGVVRDAKFESLRKPVEPTIFVPYSAAYPYNARAFAVRTGGEAQGMTEPVRRAIASVNPDVVMLEVKTEDRLIEESLHQERLFAALLTWFGGFALALAAIGLHGVTAYTIARRTPEIGLRMALGADRRQVLALILRQALRPVVVGAMAGLGASVAATRWIESMLFGVKRLDPLTFLAAAALLAAVALAAALAPSWRAARIDPMAALRAE